MQQLSLSLERFKNSIPLKPYATDDLMYGVKIQAKDKAILKRYLSVNHRYYLKWLVFDVDIPASVAEYEYSMVGVPAPNLIIENPENGHAHFLYELKDAVYLSDSAHDKPIRYAHAVYCALRAKLGADIGYTGLITKNALHMNWNAYSYYSEPYSLQQLSSKLDITWQQAKKPIPLSEAIYLGRNCKVFDDVRHWAYVEIRKYRGSTYPAWFDTVLNQCVNVNSTFTSPLGYNEIKAIAKSISKWVWKRDGYAYQEFIDRQTRKGKLGAAKGGKARSNKYQIKRAQAYKLKEQGMNNTAIAKELEVTRRTIINWLGV
ncbi:replication initiation protein [Acinetobacter faecalis]|uniref:replication initiation protein n=1 Tax=Acinetobacter faecalis TaxID=2665161 RepID=UPI002A90D418|nr:replication initiation protein [Acinetobacter faecalis]MDY6458107.1 replication initiation protein [Acinetobacter faecalis]